MHVILCEADDRLICFSLVYVPNSTASLQSNAVATSHTMLQVLCSSEEKAQFVK